MTKTRLYARESVAFDHVLTIRDEAGDPVDITGWTFTCALTRQKGDNDIALVPAASGGQGFEVVDGPAGALRLVIDQSSLAGVGDTTGDFTLFGDLLGTPGSGTAKFAGDLRLNVTDSGVDFPGGDYSVVVAGSAAVLVQQLQPLVDEAAEYKIAAETSSSYAEEFSGPAYGDIATGEAATTPGQFFRVWNGDTPRTYTRYERTAGGSAVAAPLATTQNLASPDPLKGAALSGYKRSANARVLDVRRKLLETTSMADYATGDGATNDGPGARKVITDTPFLGALITIPRGEYKLDAASGAALTFTQPTSLVGASGIYSAINPAFAAAADDTIVYNPNPGLDHTGQVWGGFTVGDPYSGQRVGRDGVVIKTMRGGQNLRNFSLSDIIIGAGEGYGFRHENNGTKFDGTGSIAGTTLTITAIASGEITVGQLITDADGVPLGEIVALGTGAGGTGTYTLDAAQNFASATIKGAANVNGGLATSRLTNVIANGGLKFDGSGDSITVAESLATGANIGLDVRLVSGASCFTSQNCNITNAGGAIRVRSGNRFLHQNDNTENFLPGALAENEGAVWNVNGESGDVVGGVFRGGLCSIYGTSDATHGLKLANCEGIEVDGVTFLTGLPNITAIEIYPTAKNTKIRSNIFSGDLANRIVDNGIGTMGVRKTAALQSNWQNYPANSYGMFGFERCIDTGDVMLFGHIRFGIDTAGTLLFTLPVGFRPLDAQRIQVYSTVASAAVDVFPDGTVLVVNAASGIISFNGARFPVADRADVITSE